ncbi:MAG TPA: hypothetical protein VM840_03695, partial [Actinomycetota bacterium]|nr:hypothetical protein [Actinomycetota bacterium]
MKQATRPSDFVASEVTPQRTLVRLWTIAFGTVAAFVLVLVAMVLTSPGDAALPSASEAPRAPAGPRSSPCI